MPGRQSLLAPRLGAWISLVLAYAVHLGSDARGCDSYDQ
jgi:hypothetical protein